MPPKKTDILLYGTASTTFLHIKKVVEAVIRKANLPVSCREVTDIHEILAAEVDTVPCLKIGSQIFSFSGSTASNLLLKRAMIHLLRIHNYGDWPCIVLPFKNIDTVTKPFLYAHQLANQNQSSLELQYVNPEIDPKSKKLQLLEKKVQTTNEEPMGQILSRPMIGQTIIKRNICDHIVDFVSANKNRPMIVPRSIWDDCEREIRQIQPHLSAPLLSINENISYQSRMKAHWWMDVTRVGAQTFQALENLYDWYELDITILADREQKKRVMRIVSEYEGNFSFSFQWLSKKEVTFKQDLKEDLLVLLNSSELHPILLKRYVHLKGLIHHASSVVLLPECRSSYLPRKKPRSTPKEKELPSGVLAS